MNGLVRKLARYGLKQIMIVDDARRTLPSGEDNIDLTDDRVLGSDERATHPMCEH